MHPPHAMKEREPSARAACGSREAVAAEAEHKALVASELVGPGGAGYVAAQISHGTPPAKRKREERASVLGAKVAAL